MDVALIRTSLLAASLSFALAGCMGGKNNKPSCPRPEGVSCMSVAEVYEATNFTDRLVSPSGVESSSATSKTTATPVSSLALNAKANGVSLALLPPQTSYSAPATAVRKNHDAPYREEARVMQIYIAPWEDEFGNLHMGSDIFSEIEPRRWTVGQKATTSGGGFTLLESFGQGAAQEAQAKAGNAPANARRPKE